MANTNSMVLWKVFWRCCLGSGVAIIALFWLIANRPEALTRVGVNGSWVLGALVFLFVASLAGAVVVKNAEKRDRKE